MCYLESARIYLSRRKVSPLQGKSQVSNVHLVHRCGTSRTTAQGGPSQSQQEKSPPCGLQPPQALWRLAPRSSFLSFLNNLLCSHLSVPRKCSSLPWLWILQLGLPCGHHINVSCRGRQAPRWALFHPETSGSWWNTLPESLLQARASCVCGGSSHSVLVISSKTESVPVLPVD